MEKKACVTIAITIWLVCVTFLGFIVKALPNHVVAGGVFGPGGDKSPGVTNPANAVDMVFYSTSQPSYPIIVGPDSFTPADGTDPAIYARDVGNIWDWLDGDEMVAVFETLRGVGGWTGVNHTTSLTTILQTGSPVQDIGNSTLELFPTIASVKGPDWVNITWSALADAGGNVQVYRVYRSPTPTGLFVEVANVTHAPGLKYYNDTALSPGQVCYNLSVIYRRDNVGGLYETIGRSETMCTIVTGVPPRILSTDPTSGAYDVPLTAPIVVNFSKQMDIVTVNVNINPSNVVLSSFWTVGDTVLTLMHITDFTQCTSYNVSISGNDTFGNNLNPTPTMWSFSTICPFPYIVSTNPSQNATQVRMIEPIVIMFSKPMNIGTVSYMIIPDITLTFNWTIGNTVLTLNHTMAFNSGTTYNITISGQDLSGNPLGAGFVNNPWEFKTNTLPTAIIDPMSTLIGKCCSGGSDLVIPWTMSDGSETPVDQLIVWLNYTIDSIMGPIAGPLTGRTSPDSYTWTVPTIEGQVEIWLTVEDGIGDRWQDISASIEIDATPPTVLSIVPPNGATNIATNEQVIITFNESMQTSTVVVSFSPPVSNVQLSWSTANTTVTVSHSYFEANIGYTVTVAATARDECTPGNEMGTAFNSIFTTGSGPKAPMPPTNLTVTSITMSDVTLTWDAPTKYTDGSSLSALEISGYYVYRATSPTGQKVIIRQVTQANFSDSDVEAGQTYYYWVTAIDINNIESDYSNGTSATIPEPERGSDWLIILIIIIVILLIVGIFLLFHQRKLEAEPPEPIKEEPTPPSLDVGPVEAPVEEIVEPKEETVAEEIIEQKSNQQVNNQ